MLDLLPCCTIYLISSLIFHQPGQVWRPASVYNPTHFLILTCFIDGSLSHFLKKRNQIIHFNTLLSHLGAVGICVTGSSDHFILFFLINDRENHLGSEKLRCVETGYKNQEETHQEKTFSPCDLFIHSLDWSKGRKKVECVENYFSKSGLSEHDVFYPCFIYCVKILSYLNNIYVNRLSPKYAIVEIS